MILQSKVIPFLRLNPEIFVTVLPTALEQCNDITIARMLVRMEIDKLNERHDWLNWFQATKHKSLRTK